MGNNLCQEKSKHEQVEKRTLAAVWVLKPDEQGVEGDNQTFEFYV